MEKKSKQERPKYPTIPIHLRVERQWVPGQTSGGLHMTVADMDIEVSEGDKKIGSIRGCMGGGTEVNIGGKFGEHHGYFVQSLALWNAVVEAHEQRSATDKLIDAVRAWANSDCGAKAADQVLARLAEYDDAALKAGGA